MQSDLQMLALPSPSAVGAAYLTPEPTPTPPFRISAISLGLRRSASAHRLSTKHFLISHVSHPTSSADRACTHQLITWP